MTIRELIEELECYDEKMEVRIGMVQNYGSNFAMNISEIGEHTVNQWYGEDFKALVITQGSQIGIVNYDDDDDDFDDNDE